MTAADVVDAVIEAPVVTSFTRIGYELRRRLDHWRSLDSYDLTGRVALVTGGTSGIGYATASSLAGAGAQVVIVGRRSERNQAVVSELVEHTGNPQVDEVAADMGDLDQVRSLADAVIERFDRLDLLVHNAGALSDTREEAPSGIEATVASQVVGPFLLTALMLGRLIAAKPARVLTVSSGGMYTAGLTVDELQMSADEYSGTTQYARAKRAQVTLNQIWADKLGDRGVHFHAMHPGWADTPGVESALPRFARVVGPLLRTPEQAADTLVWLAADDAAIEANGEFWLDRRTRPVHRLGSTRRTDTPARRERLWDWVCSAAGVDPRLSETEPPS